MIIADAAIQALKTHFHMMGEVRTLAAINIVLALLGFTVTFLVSKALISSWGGTFGWVIVLVSFVYFHLRWLEQVMQPCVDCYKESDDPNFGSGFLLFAFFSQPLIAISGWLIGPIWHFVGSHRAAGRQP